MTRENERRSFAGYRDTAWGLGPLRLLAIGSMGAGFACGPVAAVWALGGLDLTYLVVIALFVAFGAAYTTDRLGLPERRLDRGLAVRLGEFVLVLLVARLAAWAFSTGLPTKLQIGSWLTTPAAFFDAAFVAAVVTLTAAWGLAMLAASDFEELRIHPDEVAARESRSWGDSASHWRASLPVDRREVLGRFARRWLGAGIFLVACAALARFEVQRDVQLLLRFTLRDIALPPVVLGGMIVYFTAGLLLVSDGRLATLRGRWYNQGVDIAASLLARWHVTAVIAVLIVAGVALLLPLGPTGWLADVVTWVLALIWRAALWLLALLQFLVALVLLAFRGGSDPEEAAPLAPQALPDSVPTQAQAMLRMPEWLVGAVLWSGVVVVAIFLLVRFFAGMAPGESPVADSLMRLRNWWRARRVGMRAAWRLRTSRFRLRRRRSARGTTGDAAPTSMPALPRNKVRAYYIDLLARARERGVARPPSETPSEYVRRLDAAWPDEQDNFDEMIGAFLDARYGATEIEAERVRTVQEIWRRLRQALRRDPEGE